MDKTALLWCNRLHKGAQGGKKRWMRRDAAPGRSRSTRPPTTTTSRPCRDDKALFELLELEGFQAGLTWRLILERRQALNAAFAGFDPAVLANWGEAEIAAALAAPGVIKNRSKARCAVTNARAFLQVQEEWGSFADYLWHWVDGVPVDHRLERTEDMPAEDDLSRRVSADLKKRGFRFVGPVIVYSYLQGAGLINDHLVTCPWHDRVQEEMP